MTGKLKFNGGTAVLKTVGKSGEVYKFRVQVDMTIEEYDYMVTRDMKVHVYERDGQIGPDWYVRPQDLESE